MLAACAARRWLARNAAGVKRIRCYFPAEAHHYTSLVSCLPALEDVTLGPFRPFIKGDLECLLGALACCPRLRALDLPMTECRRQADGNEDLMWTFPDASAFAKLSSLTRLSLSFDDEDPYTLAAVAGALTPLTNLAELRLDAPQADMVPAALGQLKGLRCLALQNIRSPRALEAGCLDLPLLQSLKLAWCEFEGAEVLPGVSALRGLTSIEFSGFQSFFFFDPELVQLPRLARLVMSQDKAFGGVCLDTHPGLLRLPADMGVLGLTLVDLDISGLRLAQFPLPVVQLVALERLDASKNEFAQLPAAITAQSRLTELRLGRVVSRKDPLQLHEKCRLDARALGDLSGFPALRELTLNFCEALLCPSLLGAARHASLASLCFCDAHPAPECAPVVLQLSQELRRLRRVSVVRSVRLGVGYVNLALRDAQGQAPCENFMAALKACEL